MSRALLIGLAALCLQVFTLMATQTGPAMAEEQTIALSSHHSGNLSVYQDSMSSFATLRIEAQFAAPIVLTEGDIALAASMTVAADLHPDLGRARYQRRLAELQASLRLALADEHMAIVLSAPRESFRAALSLVSEAIASPSFDADAMKLAETQVRTLLAKRRSNPRKRAASALLQKALPDACTAPLERGRGDGGAHQNVVRRTPIRLALAGDIDDAIVDVVRKSVLFRSDTVVRDTRPCRLHEPSETTQMHDQTPQSVVSFLLDVGERNASRHDGAETLRVLLEARLQQVLRQENGLTYRVNTDLLLRGDTVLLLGQFGVDPDAVETAVRLTTAEIERFQDAAGSPAEVEIAQTRARVDRFTATFSTMATAARLLRARDWGAIGMPSKRAEHGADIGTDQALVERLSKSPIHILVLGMPGQ